MICVRSASQAAPATAAWQNCHRYRSFCQTETVLRNIAVPVLAPVPAFEAVARQLDELVASGGGELDHSALFTLLEGD